MQSADPKRWQLVCRGLPIDVDFAVKGWQEHGMRWDGRHRTFTAFVCHHWTGAENPPATVYSTLSAKKLSVHFVVDQGGVVYQMADTELRCAHAGEINASSIGIEWVNRGTALTHPNRGHARKIVTATIHGKPTRYYEFTEPQLRVAVKLSRVLCSLYGLPLAVPTNARGELITRELVKHELERFQGCVGHLHIEPGKPDPGVGLLRALRDAA